MKFILTVVCIAFAICGRLAADAPQSIEGIVYRDHGGNPSLRSWHSSTIEFREDGRFITVVSVVGSSIDPIWTATLKYPIYAVGGDGAYTYTRTDTSTARVDLQYDSGAAHTLWLTFADSSSGTAIFDTSYYGQLWFTCVKRSALDSAPALNVSTRGAISPGRPMIVGFVVPTPSDPSIPESREVLIRAVGPSLTSFGVSDVCPDPDFELASSGGWPTLSGRPSLYGNWSTLQYAEGANLVTRDNPGGQEAFEKIFKYVGAFPLDPDSNDAVDLLRIPPGAYTVIASVPEGQVGGEVLLEVYFLP